MNKIPVGQTIAFAYSFLFARIGAVVGIAGFPAVLTGVAGYLARIYATSHRADLEAGEPSVAGVYFLVSLSTLLVMIVASSIVAVGVTREVLEPQDRGMGFHVSLGQTEWRMFAANLRFFAGSGALFLLAAIISALAFVLAGVPLNAPERAEPTMAALLAGLISWFVFIYAFVTILRMGFLLPAVVVGETKSGLRRAFDLIKANFWRAFVVMAALGLPVFILLGAGELVLLRSALGPDFTSIPPAEFMERVGEAMEQKILVWQVFTAVLFVLASGLIYSGGAFAYRALVPAGREPRERVKE
jgi:hypothetical protein